MPKMYSKNVVLSKTCTMKFVFFKEMFIFFVKIGDLVRMFNKLII